MELCEAAMNDNDLYSILAAILPTLLGLGLIELYVTREVSVVFIVAGLAALAIIAVLIAALRDVAKQERRRKRRH